MKKKISKDYKKILNDNKRKKVTGFKSGNFYLYKYDSKLYAKNKLEFYDASPLILCMKARGKYLLGLNLNYLPIRQKQIGRASCRERV